MTVSSESGTISTTKESTELISRSNMKNIDLNDVLADLKHLNDILNNLTIAVSLYLADRGELDPKRFKIVSTSDQQTPQPQPDQNKDPS
jgi:hypothetical protein